MSASLSHYSPSEPNGERGKRGQRHVPSVRDSAVSRSAGGLRDGTKERTFSSRRVERENNTLRIRRGEESAIIQLLPQTTCSPLRPPALVCLAAKRRRAPPCLFLLVGLQFVFFLRAGFFFLSFSPFIPLSRSYSCTGEYNEAKNSNTLRIRFVFRELLSPALFPRGVKWLGQGNPESRWKVKAGFALIITINKYVLRPGERARRVRMRWR